jgi:hypothetical protein
MPSWACLDDRLESAGRLSAILTSFFFFFFVSELVTQPALQQTLHAG